MPLRQEGRHTLVFIPHILGNMDSWDPSVTDGMAQHREVIQFTHADAGQMNCLLELGNDFAFVARQKFQRRSPYDLRRDG